MDKIKAIIVGDNFDVSMGVRDIRSDHLKHLCHVFSILAVKSRIQPPQHISSTIPRSLNHANIACFVPMCHLSD